MCHPVARAVFEHVAPGYRIKRTQGIFRTLPLPTPGFYEPGLQRLISACRGTRGPQWNVITIHGVRGDANVQRQGTHESIQARLGATINGHAVALRINACTPDREQGEDEHGGKLVPPALRTVARSHGRGHGTRSPLTEHFYRQRNRRNDEAIAVIALRRIQVEREQPRQDIKQRCGQQQGKGYHWNRRTAPQHRKPEQNERNHRNKQRGGSVVPEVEPIRQPPTAGDDVGHHDVSWKFHQRAGERQHVQAPITVKGGLLVRLLQGLDGAQVVIAPQHGREKHETGRCQCQVAAERPQQPALLRAKRELQQVQPFSPQDKQHCRWIRSRTDSGARASHPIPPGQGAGHPQAECGEREGARQPPGNAAGSDERGMQDQEDQQYPGGQTRPGGADEDDRGSGQQPQCHDLHDLGGNEDAEIWHQELIDVFHSRGDKTEHLPGDRIIAERPALFVLMKGKQAGTRIIGLQQWIKQKAVVPRHPQEHIADEQAPQ